MCRDLLFCRLHGEYSDFYNMMNNVGNYKFLSNFAVIITFAVEMDFISISNIYQCHEIVHARSIVVLLLER